MKLLLLSLFLATLAPAQIVYRTPVDNRPFLVRLLTSVSPVAETASQNAQARIAYHHAELSGADNSPGAIKWMPESWMFMLTFKTDF